MFAARPFNSSKSFSSKSPAAYSESLRTSPKKDVPVRSQSRNKSKKPTDAQEPKDTSFHPTSITDSSRLLKDHSNLVSESLFSAANGHDHSSLNMSNFHEDGERHYRKLLEEMSILKQELAEKNNMNNKLMRENANLRHEMEQFLSTVNDAREFIDIELKECNQRIQDLEEEMQELRTENGLLKDQLKSKSIADVKIEQGKPTSIQETDEMYRSDRKEGGFSSRLKEQMNQYLETPEKHHHSSLRQTPQPKIQRAKSPTSKTPKSHLSVARQTSPPLQFVRPKTPSGLASRPESTRAQGTMTPGRRSAVQRTTQDKGNEAHRSPSQKLTKGRTGQSSTEQFEALTQEEGMTSIDLGRIKKSATVSSPKMSTLKTKLKSDMILQQMKKKLVN